MEDVPDEEMRPVICWHCKQKFLLEPDLIKGRCPNCKRVNEIILTVDDLSDDLRDVLMLVQCKMCKRKILVRKESDYVICANCKSTLIVDKEQLGSIPYEYSNLTSQEYYLLLAKENAFNPYFYPVTSDYYLEPGFEKKYLDEYNNIHNSYKSNVKYNDGYDPLMETINENAMKLNSKYKK